MPLPYFPTSAIQLYADIQRYNRRVAAIRRSSETEMPDYTIPAYERLSDCERARLAELAGLIPADHPQLWSDADLLRSACRATGRPVPDCAVASRRPAAVALNARALIQVTR